MNTRRFYTVIKSDHKLGNDNYVIGRIVGAMAALCKEDPANGVEFGRGLCDAGNIIVTETTEEKYELFANVIESWYTGLCIFDYTD